jgi:hypothetical protein
LYTSFDFSFPHYYRHESARAFVDQLRPRAKMLIRSIVLIAVLDMDVGADAARDRLVRQWKGGFGVFRDELAGLKRVCLNVGFIRGPATVFVRAKLVEAVMELVGIFDGVEEVVLAVDERESQRVEIVEESRRRMRERA